MTNPENGNEIGERSNEYQLIPIEKRPGIGDDKHGKLFFEWMIKKREVVNHK